ncbi:MAG: dockerin type I repeat-containing protein [Oscillospiraceae bacterium]|nr:dockerin type I repeat-containing protein [Oscillospiraceae bacterium]
MQKVGTYKDFFTNKDLTVTEIETHQDDIDYVKIFKLSDSEGNEYNYSQDYAHVDYPVSMENAQVGDTYTFAFNGNYLLLPVETDELTVNPVSTATATGDADGSGELDILDIITVNKAILGKEILSEDKISYVDFNGNGIPDADDALTMLKMLVGLI